MGLFSSSKKKTSTTNNIGNTTNNVQNKQVAASDDGVALGANTKLTNSRIGDDYNITQTDYGAIQQANELGKTALATNLLTSQMALSGNVDLAQSSIQQANELTKLALTKTADQALADTTKLALDSADTAMRNALSNQQMSNSVQKELAGRIQGDNYTSNEKYAIIAGVVILGIGAVYLLKKK